MKTITIERNGVSFTIQATQQEVDLNEHISFITNILNVQVNPKPKEPEIITDPRYMLPDKLHSETVQDIIARTKKDPWIDYTEVARELRVSPQTIIRYCRHGVIEGDHDGRQDSGSRGWFVRQSEVDRLKTNPNWLKEAQEFVKNKPEPTPSDIIYKKRIEILHEIDTLRKFREPLNPGYADRYYKGLYGRARRYYGSWLNAITVAGIHPSQVYKRWNKSYGFKGRKPLSDSQKRNRADELLQRINRLFVGNKLDYSKRRKLDYNVRFSFGGWRELYKLLGLKTFDKSDKTIRKIRTRENIIEEIQGLQKQNIPLNYKFIYQQHRSLLKAAEKKFRGSWSAAVRVAIPGIDYSRVQLRKKRSRESIITEIWELHHKGCALNNNYLRQNNSALLSSAVKIFGSWSRAIQEAGLEYEAIVKINRKSKKVKENEYVQSELLCV
jgi:hypothetical protein